MFQSAKDIFDYLELNKSSIENANVEQVGAFVVPIFISPITDDPAVMMKIHRWFDLETDTDFGYAIRKNFSEMMEANLSLYKFKIITQFRGPLDRDQFIETMKEKAENMEDEIEIVAKHKDFPQEIRDVLYDVTGETEYLTEEEKELFVF